MHIIRFGRERGGEGGSQREAHIRATDGALHGRGPQVQQAATRRLPAPRGRRHCDARRRYHRESFLQPQQASTIGTPTMARKIKVLKQEKTILALTSQNGIFSDFRALGTLPSLDFSVVVRQGFRQNTNRDKLDF